MNIGCIIMASGYSKRLGENKLLLKLNGVDIIDYTLNIMPQIDLSDVVIVTRYKEVAEKCIQRNLSYILHNLPCVSDTIRLGMEHLGKNLDGYMFMVADQPLKKAETINELINFYRKNSTYIVQTAYGDRRGNPVIFPSYLYTPLTLLKEEESGSVVIKANASKLILRQCSSLSELMDVDTYEDFNEIIRYI